MKGIIWFIHWDYCFTKRCRSFDDWMKKKKRFSRNLWTILRPCEKSFYQSRHTMFFFSPFIQQIIFLNKILLYMFTHTLVYAFKACSRLAACLPLRWQTRRRRRWLRRLCVRPLPWRFQVSQTAIRVAALFVRRRCRRLRCCCNDGLTTRRWRWRPRCVTLLACDRLQKSRLVARRATTTTMTAATVAALATSLTPNSWSKRWTRSSSDWWKNLAQCVAVVQRQVFFFVFFFSIFQIYLNFSFYFFKKKQNITHFHVIFLL